MQSIIMALYAPILLLNFFGGIIGGIWLIFLGEWGAIASALLVSIGGIFIISFLLMPAVLISAPGMILFEKGGIKMLVAFPLLFIGSLWTFVIMSTWAFCMFYNFFDPSEMSSLIPRMLVAYGAATGPWTHIARKEAAGGNEYALLPAFYLTFASTIAFLCLAFTKVNPIAISSMFVLIMLIFFIIHLTVAIKKEKWFKY